MRLLLLAALAAAQMPSAFLAPHRLKAGDILTISANGLSFANGVSSGTPTMNGTSFSGDYQVLDDGAIYGPGFGRVSVAGKTWEQAQTAIRAALSRFVRPREVTLALKTQRIENVYLVGPGGKGEVPYRPALTLRQLIANTPVDKDADLTDVQLFRQGSAPKSFSLSTLLSKDAPGDITLRPDDVVTLTPTAFLRVWVTGSVKEPGLVRVPANSDPYEAVAAAGGFLKEQNSADATEDDVIQIHRGDSTVELPARSEKVARTPLKAGDSITVQPAQSTRFTVAGEVTKPGEYSLKGDPDVVRAVASAGGPTPDSTLESVVVVRDGSMTRYDLSGLRDGGPLPKVPLGTGDVVVVSRNERVFYVFGEVRRPGKVVMRDEITYRLSDALAESGGINERGVLRRISVARPTAAGKYTVTQYNLDEFLKDGKLAANPEIHRGDMILFTTSRGITLSSATQALSAAFLFQSVAGIGR